MPTGLVKSMIQASLAASRVTRSAISKIAGSSGLLADAATLQRQALVDCARRLTANPQLEEDDCGIRHSLIKISRESDLSGIAILGEDAL